MDLKLKKVGGSKFLLVPHEYNKVYHLDEYNYDIQVTSDGHSITYTRILEADELLDLVQDTNIPEQIEEII